MMIIWQFYGNFIYYEWRGKTKESDNEFQKCMEQNNSGLLFCMFMILMLGYCFLLAAVTVGGLFIYTVYVRY